MQEHPSFYQRFLAAYHKNLLASLSWKFFIIVAVVGIYAPLFASSKPLLVTWHGEVFFPLLRYLLFPGYYTKPVDLFFNVLMLTFPLFVLSSKFARGWLRRWLLGVCIVIQCGIFAWAYNGKVQDPAAAEHLKKMRAEKIRENISKVNSEMLMLLPKDTRSWEMERRYMSPYEQLGILIKAKYRKKQNSSLQKYQAAFEDKKQSRMPTLRYLEIKNEEICLKRLQQRIDKMQHSYEIAQQAWNHATDGYRPFLMALIRIEHELNLAYYNNWGQPEDLSIAYADIMKKAEPYKKSLMETRQVLEDYAKLRSAIHFIQDKRVWIEKESEDVRILISPLFSSFHWEDDAGGSREMNKYVPWWQLTRVTRKDLLSALIFGIRIALVVGGIGIAIALAIGIMIGLVSGYFGGTIDMILSRFTEIWETMPILFILMLVISITQKKSLILNTVLLGSFGWTGFSRYVRIEVLKQRDQGYVLAATNLGYSHYYIMVHQILPNAIVPVISLVPFAMMAMISCEAGLTFLGLGEESSASWGNLMREGVTGFPAESAVLWPPAFILTMLLIAIALIGDGVRDALDPRLQDS
ncbi:Inner membrane ABC transporter permease protein yejE,microcin C ABC transporter permease,ABC-type antimicrobial peptide transport system, permease component,nickel ABC transporter, permease subunit NikC,Binding-protein-dependent transport system inner membrane component [Chlamydia serpentis]|uniref:ABC transmembrane type-1 domain-containing protein n=1 Tax=Chlamydia serpentis TaxID=1967782 RepID=A0A2R8FBS8_9CHLA|nr:ABC transporter permease [Chlamydia serpentis]SPN73717.1 Inner membrane ABC transporter permease protein yejE,microcin C ABC transporter permease,ABC-type antimicrobial peptide transport system, permease component,nickel ABC transporter, permease subunit NikC,Binding-protein-dependent transport system inner membrane component [Chlamydia serpentis]